MKRVTLIALMVARLLEQDSAMVPARMDLHTIQLQENAQLIVRHIVKGVASDQDWVPAINARVVMDCQQVIQELASPAIVTVYLSVIKLEVENVIQPVNLATCMIPQHKHANVVTQGALVDVNYRVLESVMENVNRIMGQLA